ncbi:MAG TPA: 2-phospho-L-lactate transferase, partial [Solirubrobacterales bacterium]|nr:2-phospho-L-lactate transferase [Solirubrobacterales bacterium]
MVALCGGIGGAKLALGLYRVLGPDELTLIVNTGDDFEHLGLHVSPDLDTVLYTLSGLADPERGWGRADESWNFMAALSELGGEDWFRLGDRDLAIHVLRAQWLRSGRPLSRFMADAARRLGIRARIVPMSNDPVRTMVQTSDGVLPFQRYFVERRCEPQVLRIWFEGASAARPAAEAIDAIAGPRLEAVVICPSNPYLSVDPILAVPGLREALESAAAPVVAVSPIIGGAAVKGPTTKIMAELGVDRTSAAIAAHYRGLLDGLVIDNGDVADAPALDIAVEAAPTLMRDLADREAL